MAVYGQIMFFGVILGIMFGIVGKFLWEWYQNKKWNISVPVFMQRGNSIIMKLKERGRIVKSNEGYSVIKLKKSKDIIKPPKYDVLTLTEGGQTAYPIFNVAKGQYFPIATIFPKWDMKKYGKEELEYLLNNDANFKKNIISLINGKYIPMKMLDPPALEMVEDASAKNWGVLEARRLYDKWKPSESWFSKYGSMVISIIMMVCIIFFVIYFSSRFESIAASMSNAADKIALGLGYMSGNAPLPTQNVTVVP